MANPPLIDTDVGNSAPGVPQPIIASGPSLPPSFPIAPAGTWLPPPTVGDPVGVPEFPPTGTDTAPVAIPPTAPFATPVVPPGTGVEQEQPQIASGPSLPPAFPLYTAPGPVQPIVLTGQMNIGNASTVPTTPGTQPILVSTVNGIPQLPWNPPSPAASPFEDEGDGEEETARSPYTGIHQRVAEELASARGIRSEPPTPEREDWQPQHRAPSKKPTKKRR